MLESIYSSKLYRSSTRKHKIQSAINDPVNSELVGQLAKALGDNYRKPEYLVKGYNTDPPEDLDNSTHKSGEDSNDDSTKDDTSTKNNSNFVSHHSNNAPDNISLDDDASRDKEGDDPLEDSKLHTDSKSASQPNSEPVQESISLLGNRIVGSQIREKFKNMQQVSDEIKGLLNFKDSTKGVNRILVKENELWIYYNDDINLNNVMAQVIETLNASGYTYLEFNRLARSDNSIVFQLIFKDTDNAIKSYSMNS